MQDIRNILNVKLIRRKVEKRTQKRIGQVLRIDSQKPTKIAVLGWLTELEKWPKTRGKKWKTLLHWQKLLKEAGVNWQEAAEKAQYRKKWKDDQRRNDTFTKIREKKSTFPVTTLPSRETRRLPQFHLSAQFAENFCLSVGGLKIQNRTHSTTNTEFECRRCGRKLKTESALRNNEKSCLSKNPSRRIQKRKARVYKAKYVPCVYCEVPQSATNMARHVRSCPERKRASHHAGGECLEEEEEAGQVLTYNSRIYID